MRQMILGTAVMLSLGLSVAYTSHVLFGSSAVAQAGVKSNHNYAAKPQQIDKAISSLPYSVKQPHLPFTASRKWAVVNLISGEHPEIEMSYYNSTEKQFIIVSAIKAKVVQVSQKYKITNLTLPDGNSQAP